MSFIRKQTLQKNLLVPLVIVVIAFIFTACTNNSPVDSPNPTEPSKAAETVTQESNFNMTGLPIVKNSITLNVMQGIRDTDNIDLDGLWWVEEYEKKTNIHVNYTSVKGADWDTKINLMFASGEYPDVIIGPTVGNNGPIDIEAYGVSEHILLPLNELIDEYMPIYKERLSKSDGWKSLISSDGKMYTLGNLSSVGYTVNGQYFINKKWLDKLSIPVPTTVTELTDVFRAFKTSDPNENGELDEIPWVATFDNVHSGVYTAFSFWGIPENGKYITINDEDKIEFTPYMQGYRECLEWLSQIYQEGLLDIESITQSENVFLAKLNEDKAGFFAYFRLAAMNIDPTVETHELMMPVAAEGYSPKLSKTLELAGPSVFVTVSNQYVPETMRWLDTMLEPRNCVESMFGPEGELWTYNDSGVAKLLGSDQESVKYALNVNTFYYLPAGMFSEILEMPQFVMDKADFCTQYDESGFLEKNSFQLLTNVIKPTVDESAQLDLYRTDIEKFIKESITDFIQNGVTDQSWSNFQATLQDLNVEEYLKIYQDVYDRFISN